MGTDGIVLAGIAKRFGRRWALRGVHLRVAAGSVVALMGHNGSGKSTLLRIVATSLRPTRGDGSILGYDLRREADRIRGHMGVLYHEPGVYGDLTARENLEFARRMWGGETAAPADHVLERVGLAAAAEERAAAFSSGMMRRLALARLIMRPTRILLLDEPYASFDADGIELVNEMVRAAAERGGVVLIATHDPERSARVVDHVVTLQEGRVVPEAPTPPRLRAEAAR